MTTEKQRPGARYLTFEIKVRDVSHRRKAGWTGREEENEVLNKIIVALSDAGFTNYFISNFLKRDKRDIKAKLEKWRDKYTLLKGQKVIIKSSK